MKAPAGKSSARALTAKLRGLRRLVRQSVALRATSLLVAALAGCVLASYAIDRTFRMSVPWRIAVDAVLALVLLRMAWRRFLRPIFTRLPDRTLADLIERRYPDLEDRFRSALEFSRDPAVLAEAAGNDDIGLTLKRKVVSDALGGIAAVDPSEVVDTPRVVGALTGGVAAAVAVAVIAGAAFESFHTWWRRDVLFEDVDWPYRTRLVVEGFPEPSLVRGVPRGDPLKIVVRAEGEVPSRVRIRLDYERETLRSNLVREGDRTFVHDHAEVSEGFKFVLDGGDFRTRVHEVRVLERPEVKQIRITLVHPPYTRLPQQTVEGDVGDLAVPEGSTLKLEATATKPLQRAWLETEGKEVALQVSAPDAARFSGEYVPARGGTVTVHLADVDGVPPAQWFRFNVTPVPDKAPVVVARAEGVGALVTPEARIPFKVRATDDYAVASIGVAYDLTAEKAEPRRAAEPFPPIDEPAPVVDAEPAWELGPLSIQPEARLEVRITAADQDAIHGAKTGASPALTFLVVTPERLGEELLRREEEQRRALERAVVEERLVRDSVYRLIDEAWKAEGPLADPVVKEMTGLSRVERQLSRQLGGIAGAMRLLRDEMLNNRIGKPEDIERIVNAVIDPLVDLGERQPGQE